MKSYGLHNAALLLLLSCGGALAGQAAPETTRYLAFQIFTGGFDSAEMRQSLPQSPDSLLTTVRDIRTRVNGSGAPGRRLGFIPGPLAFDHTDEQVRQLIAASFDIALQTELAVGFHIDDSMFWGRLKSLNLPGNIGTRLMSEPLDISRRTVVVSPPKAGVLFATVRKPRRAEEYAYIVLLRYGGKITSYGSGSRSPGADCLLDHFGSWGETRAGFELNGTPIDLEYRVELNDDHTDVSNEVLTVGKDRVDLASGRLFLVDVSVQPLVYRQMKVRLSAPLEARTAAEAERSADALRQALASQHPDIKAFLR